jgi:hypothetical protein
VTSKERFTASIEHREGPVPVDFGSSAVSGMHISCVAALREYYGLDKHPVKLIEPYQMLGEIEADLMDAAGIDVTGIYPESTMFGFKNRDWHEWMTPWNQTVLVPHDFRTEKQSGDVYIYPEGDTTAPPSGKMPEGGYFFDTIVRQEEIVESELDPEDNLEEFGEITDETLSYLETEAAKAADSGRGVLANFGGTGLGDIALVPAPMLKEPKGIRDIAEWYMSTVSRRDYVHEIFSRQTEIALRNLEKIYKAVGERVQAVFICGTDFGTQASQFCSIESFRELYTPYYSKINDWVHRNTGWKTFKHSCGAVEPFMQEFIDAGFDIINPVQCSAAGMDPRELKRRYGKALIFWGGGVDTQKTLPFGSPDEVRSEVLSRCELFSAGGGFVFNAIHNVQAKTPVENIAAMLDAVREFNG